MEPQENVTQFAVKPKEKRNVLNTVLVILVAIILVVGAAAGTYAYRSNKANEAEAALQSQIDSLKKKVDQQSAELETAKEANEPATISEETASTSVVAIKDLGLRVTVPASLTDLTSEIVHLAGDQAVNSVVLSSLKVEKAGCTRSSAPLGTLTYDSDKGGVVVAKARGSNLYYIQPTNKCSSVTTKNLSDLQTALKSLVSDD